MVKQYFCNIIYTFVTSQVAMTLSIYLSIYLVIFESTAYEQQHEHCIPNANHIISKHI